MPIKRVSRGEDNVNAYVIEHEEEEDNDSKIMYCESCQNNGYVVRLKKRLYYREDKSGKQVLTEPDSDFNEWRQCYRCGEIYKIKETKVQGSLGDIVEVDSEESVREPHVQVLIPRKKAKGTGRLQKLRDAKSEIKDKEALKAIKQGERVENYNEFQLD